MPKEYYEIKASVRKSHPDWSESKVDEVASKIFGKTFGTNPKHAEELQKEGKWESYKKSHSGKKEFDDCVYEQFTSGLELKEEGENFYVEGFVSAPDIDLGFDIVENQNDIISQLESGNALAVKLSYRHDWLKVESEDYEKYPPVGRYVKGSGTLKQHPLLGKEAAWAKFKMNQRHPKFNEIKDDIQDGYVDGFSIEYKAIDFVTKVIGNIAVRIIKSLKLIGVGLAARPMNPNAVMTGFALKEYEYLGKAEGIDKNINITSVNEVDKMSEEEKDKEKVEPPAEPGKIKPEKVGEPTEGKELSELKKQVAELKEKQEIEALRAEMKELTANKKVLVPEGNQKTETKEAKDKEKESNIAMYKEYNGSMDRTSFIGLLVKSGAFSVNR